MGNKAWDDRLVETVQFLRVYNTGANAQYAAAVGHYIDQRRIGAGLAMKPASKKMAQGSYPMFSNRAVEKDYRKRRRVLFLIKTEVLNVALNNAKAQVNSIADINLDTQINTALGDARTQLLQQVRAAWNQFEAQPGTFLNTHEIIIRKDSTGGVRGATFAYDCSVSRYRLYPTNLPTGPDCIDTQVQVNHIPVTRWADVVGNLANLPSVDCTDNHLVVTTQLTGCSYVYQINGAQLRVAHIWPDGAIDGQLMGTQLADNAGFAAGNGGPIAVFKCQPTNNNTGYTNVATWTYPVARYIGGWQLHVQQVPQGGGIITYWRAV